MIELEGDMCERVERIRIVLVEPEVPQLAPVPDTESRIRPEAHDKIGSEIPPVARRIVVQVHAVPGGEKSVRNAAGGCRIKEAPSHRITLKELRRRVEIGRANA